MLIIMILPLFHGCFDFLSQTIDVLEGDVIVDSYQGWAYLSVLTGDMESCRDGI